MAGELWDLYNAEFIRTGRTIRRGETIPQGLFHLVVHIWYVGSDSRVLIQQRNKPDDSTSGLWFCTGGSALAGESSIDAAIRETGEELGIILSAEDLRRIARSFHEDCVLDVWICRWNGSIGDLVLDPGEVRAVRWVGVQDIEDMTETGSFWALRDGYMDMLSTEIEKTVKQTGRR